MLAFDNFDGLKRHCIRFKMISGDRVRCVKFQKNPKGKAVSPRCTRLVDGGRSQGLIRKGSKPCPVRRATKGASRRTTRRARRTTRRSRR